MYVYRWGGGGGLGGAGGGGGAKWPIRVDRCNFVKLSRHALKR